MKRTRSAAGFTIVEVAVALGVVTLFLTFFFQLYMSSEAQRINILRRTLASDIAYSNLRKFRERPASLACDAPTMDLTANPNAGGAELSNVTYSFGSEPVPASLGQGVTQTVLAFAPAGCATFTTTPLKIISKVSYNSGQEVMHVSYIK